MRSRKFNKKIQVYNTVSVNTPGGGHASEDVFVTGCWANVKTLKGSKQYAEIGLDFTRNIVEVTMRLRQDLIWNSTTMFFVYRNIKFAIENYPTNLNYTDAFIKFIATEIKPNYVSGSNTMALDYERRVEIDGGIITDRDCMIAYVNSLQ